MNDVGSTDVQAEQNWELQLGEITLLQGYQQRSRERASSIEQSANSLSSVGIANKYGPRQTN